LIGFIYSPLTIFRLLFTAFLTFIANAGNPTSPTGTIIPTGPIRLGIRCRVRMARIFGTSIRN
jgi:hypothetical protein